MEDFKESLAELKRALDKEIRKVTAKNDITPIELENMTKTLCLIEKIKMIEEGDEYWDDGQSGRHYPMMRSYVMDPNMMYYPPNEGLSGRRMRSSTTGRYMSGHYTPDPGRSGHSIKDRMIAKLEEMYDEAKTDHERLMVDEWINRLADSPQEMR